LPITFSILFAKWTADLISGPYYDELVEVKNIPYLEQKPPQRTMTKTVKDIMTADVDCFNTVETVGTIYNLLLSTKHNGFPVVDVGPSGDKRNFRGLILRKELIYMLATKKQYQDNKDSLVAPNLDYAEFKDFLGTKPPSLEKLLPSESESRMYIDLSPFVNKSAIKLSASFSFMEAYKLFRLLELRHLTVIDDFNNVVGIITRHDLLFFHFEEADHHNFVEDNL